MEMEATDLVLCILARNPLMMVHTPWQTFHELRGKIHSHRINYVSFFDILSYFHKNITALSEFYCYGRQPLASVSTVHMR